MRRRTLILFIACLIAHAGLLVWAALRNSACYDEGPHLAAGAAYLTHGEFSIYNLSPPLARMWAAAPAVLSDVDAPPAKRFRDFSASSRWGRYCAAFQEINLVRLRLDVLRGRLMMMPFSIAIGAMIFFWARELYGDGGGLFACAAWSLSPTALANGMLVGTDTTNAVGMLAAVWLWSRFLRTGRTTSLLGAAACIGLTHAIKFTALLLWPIVVVIALVELVGKRAKSRDAMIGGVVLLIFTFVIVNAAYGFRLIGELG